MLVRQKRFCTALPRVVSLSTDRWVASSYQNKKGRGESDPVANKEDMNETHARD